METALVNAAVVNLNRDMMAATIFGFGFVPQVVLNFEITFGINRRFSLIVIKIKNGKYLRIGNMLFIQDFFDLPAGAAGDDMNLPSPLQGGGGKFSEIFRSGGDNPVKIEPDFNIF